MQIHGFEPLRTMVQGHLQGVRVFANPKHLNTKALELLHCISHEDGPSI